jgi:hypothetical protein
MVGDPATDAAYIQALLNRYLYLGMSRTHAHPHRREIATACCTCGHACLRAHPWTHENTATEARADIQMPSIKDSGL